MWKSDLENRRKASQDIPRAIVLNAWESDFCGDPLVSIVTELIHCVGGGESNSSSLSATNLREAAKDVGWLLTGFGNSVVSHMTGVDIVAVGEMAQSKREGRQPKTPDFVTHYEQRVDALSKLKNALNAVFCGESPKAIIFVDELDRCRPDFAINYIETIKHVFDLHGLIFILAVDRGQLNCSARTLFGSELDVDEYMRKFVHRSFSLPEPDQKALGELVGLYIKTYFERAQKRFSLMKVDSDDHGAIVELLSALRLKPRQIQECFRIVGYVLSCSEERKGGIRWPYVSGTILMSGIKVGMPTSYRLVLTDAMTRQQMGKSLLGLLGIEKARWWFDVYVTGSGLARLSPEERNRELKHLYQELGFVSTATGQGLISDLDALRTHWGHPHVEGIKEIVNRIETVTTF
jgi:hypothetical protein